MISKKTVWLSLLLSLVAAAALLALFFATRPAPRAVTNFKECLAAGYPILESYPRRCRTPDGRTFVEDIGNALEKTDLIQVTAPRPNQVVSSPLVVEGQARGNWYFEASFPVHLVDANGKELTVVPAQAQGEWMTTDFVPFTVELVFSQPTTAAGTLVLKKDNPSGLPEHDDLLRIPVAFR